MENDYSRGLSDGYRGADDSFKKVAPFWVYGAIDCTFAGLEPQYNFCGAFKNRSDAESFIEYRKGHIVDRETLFKIKDYSKEGAAV